MPDGFESIEQVYDSGGRSAVGAHSDLVHAPGMHVDTGSVKVELLYFGGCPNAEKYLPHLRELVATTSHQLVEREIIDGEQAVAESFLGSPTVRVDGRDVEPGAVERTDFGMSCRIYLTPGGSRGTPPDEWVWRALGEGER